jgi:hypothetical protein
MVDDANKKVDWYFWAKCRKCGEKAVAFRDPSRGKLRPIKDGDYALTCGSCGHARIYAAADLRSGPVGAPGPGPKVA